MVVTGTVQTVLDELRVCNEEAFELAVLLSAAVRIEQPLVRRVRLDFLSTGDPSAEADLWFSPLVRARSPLGITLRPDVLPALRKMLAARGDRDEVRATIEKAHTALPPLLALEERLIWLGIIDADESEIHADLARIAKAMESSPSRRENLSSWCARALPQLPVAVRRSAGAWVLRNAARVFVESAIPLDCDPPITLAEVSVPSLLPDPSHDVDIAVRRAKDDVTFDCSPSASGARIRVPGTDPLFVIVDHDGTRDLITISQGKARSIKVESSSVDLRCLRGTHWRLAMSSVGRSEALTERDLLRALHERLVELNVWFHEDAHRLPDAQDVWRQDELWERRVLDEEARWDELLDERKPLPFASWESSPARLLLELECLDRVAWLFAGHASLPHTGHIHRGGRTYYLIRRARECLPVAARQAGLIHTHMRHHTIVPARVEIDPVRSYSVRVVPMSHGALRCEEAVARGHVTVATTSFDDDAQIDFQSLTVPTADDRARKLAREIAAAAEAGVDILVAPELTLPPSAREALIRELRWSRGPRLALLVLGSFHEREEDGVFNRALLIDGSGNVLCEHRKLTKFGRLDDGWFESIALGDEITLVITPIGTVAIAIGKDLTDDHVGTVWQYLQPEWLLVPAYGRGLDSYKTAATRLARMQGTITVVAHQGDRLLGIPSKSFVCEATLTQEGSDAPEYSKVVINILKSDLS